jgi:hypothetical protein
MRALILLSLLLAGCSSSAPAPTPERADGAPSEEKKAASSTDACLDNPELAKSWGECNVKNTVFGAGPELEKCRKASPKAKGAVSFELHIAPNGSVKRAKALGAHHGKHTSCVAKVLQKLQFAPPGKDATITVPYQLEP